MKNDWEMACINLIYCSICTALFTTLGRPGQVAGREEGGGRKGEEELSAVLSQSERKGGRKDLRANKQENWAKLVRNAKEWEEVKRGRIVQKENGNEQGGAAVVIYEATL